MPDDISVVGYGDPAWFDLLSPALTAVGLPVEAIADMAANQLFSQINHRKTDTDSTSPIIRIMPRLVLRASTKRLPPS
ncbi:DNA-binding transcriptional repressor PurR [compost metagenome]